MIKMKELSLSTFLLMSFFSTSTAAAEIGLTAQPFQLAGGASLNNIKLSWTSTSGASQFTIQRKSNKDDHYTVVAQVQSTTFDDYQVPEGQVAYRLSAAGSTEILADVVTTAAPLPSTSGQTNSPASPGWLSYNNTQESTFKTKSTIKIGSTFYQYSVQSDKDAMKQIVEMTSSNGYDFSGETVVLTREKVCAGTQDGFCKLEAVTFTQNPKTSEVVMWAHWENRRDYKEAKVAVAWGKPGGSPWQFGGSFRPQGHDSRDLTFFGDDDGSGYLLSSTNGNSDMNLFALAPDWHTVTRLVTTLLKNEHREAPSMMRYRNVYYVFTSKASGWYPSAGQYISATNIAGPWNPSRNIGNIAGFGAQSGVVQKLGSTWVMRANRWSANWIDKEPSNRQIIMPISFGEKGCADYHFYETIRYLDDDRNGGVYGVQNGQIVSVGKHATSSGSTPGHDEMKALNGIQTDTENYYRASTVPFTYDIDLGSAHTITQIDLTTRTVPGSETAYKYKLEGANQPSGPWTTLVDRLDGPNTAVGFVSNHVVNSAKYRYVRLDVQKIINVINKNEANWAQGVVDIKVYSGDRSQKRWRIRQKRVKRALKRITY